MYDTLSQKWTLNPWHLCRKFYGSFPWNRPNMWLPLKQLWFFYINSYACSHDCSVLSQFDYFFHSCSFEKHPCVFEKHPCSFMFILQFLCGFKIYTCGFEIYICCFGNLACWLELIFVLSQFRNYMCGFETTYVVLSFETTLKNEEMTYCHEEKSFTCVVDFFPFNSMLIRNCLVWFWLCIMLFQNHIVWLRKYTPCRNNELQFLPDFFSIHITC